MNCRYVLPALLLAVQLSGTSRVFAGPLNGHSQAFKDGHGPAAGGAWTGVGTYSHPFAGGHLEGTIEWAVFGPGQFPPAFAGLNGWIPVPDQLTYAYQVLNSGSDGIVEFSIGGGSNGVSNPGAASLGGANETPFTAFLDLGLMIFQFAYYDDIEEQYVGTVPASTGISVGLVLSSPRVPNLGTGDLFSEGIFRAVVLPIIATPNGALYVPPMSDADFNHNGTVDAADYVVWRNDPNHTQAGYDLWRAHFGQTAAGGSSRINMSETVPEPTTFALLFISLFFWNSACQNRSVRKGVGETGQ